MAEAKRTFRDSLHSVKSDAQIEYLDPEVAEAPPLFPLGGKDVLSEQQAPTGRQTKVDPPPLLSEDVPPVKQPVWLQPPPPPRRQRRRNGEPPSYLRFLPATAVVVVLAVIMVAAWTNYINVLSKPPPNFGKTSALQSNPNTSSFGQASTPQNTPPQSTTAPKQNGGSVYRVPVQRENPGSFKTPAPILHGVTVSVHGSLPGKVAIDNGSGSVGFQETSKSVQCQPEQTILAAYTQTSADALSGITSNLFSPSKAVQQTGNFAVRVGGRMVSAHYFQLAGTVGAPPKGFTQNYYLYGSTDISFPEPHVQGGWLTLTLFSSAFGTHCPSVTSSSASSEQLTAAKTISVSG